MKPSLKLVHHQTPQKQFKLYLSLLSDFRHMPWAEQCVPPRHTLEEIHQFRNTCGYFWSILIFAPRSISFPLISVLSNAFCSARLSCNRRGCDEWEGNSFRLACVRTGCWKQCQQLYFWSISKMTALIHFTAEPNSCQMAVSIIVHTLEFRYAE